MPDTINKADTTSGDNISDLSIYEGTCLFDPNKKIKIAICNVFKSTPEEFDYLLFLGYRKFAYRFFRYVCDCLLCSSIRIPADEYSPSGTHQRLLKKNTDLRVVTLPIRYRKNHYYLYRTHHLSRGFKVIDEDTFIQEFYFSPTEALITEIYDDGLLIGLGFLDVGASCLSSVYFVYDPGYNRRSLGMFSIIKEIELAQSMNKSYYYLGLYCKGRRFLGYKDNFSPNETLDYNTGIWTRNET
jgi:arginyl-tRNA--protein-N-Asp/Glu arginylyltransferase